MLLYCKILVQSRKGDIMPEVGGLKSKEIIWTADQEKIFEAVRYSRNNISVIARAGSGKTTTLVESVLRAGKKTLILAFNRAIANELKNKEEFKGKGIDIDTYHSHGLRILGSVLRKRKIIVDNNKVSDIIIKIAPNLAGNYHELAALKKLVAFAKNNYVSTADEVLGIAQHHNWTVINADSYVQNIHNIVIPALNMCKEDPYLIDYDDMCWLPNVLGLTPNGYEFVAIDEQQDTDFSQVAMLSNIVKGRLLSIGDERQSVYQFRGASLGSMEKLCNNFKSVQYTMPTTWRCAQSIVEKARTIVPDLQAAPNAPDGYVNENCHYDHLFDDVEPEDMILCRTVAPLIEPCLQMIRSGKNAVLRGKDGNDMIALIIDAHADDARDLVRKLKAKEARAVETYVNHGLYELAQSVVDNTEAVVAFCTGSHSISDVIKKIKIAFSETTKATVFSTIHKAKGLEAKTVWILRPDLLPHPASRMDWELVQEANLEYVAYTRAKETLNIVRWDYPKDNRQTYKTKMDTVALNKVIPTKS